MSLSLDLLAKYFDETFKYDIAMKSKNKIFNLFRKPYVKNDMSTLGLLWSQYALPARIIPTGDIYFSHEYKGIYFG